MSLTSQGSCWSMTCRWSKYLGKDCTRSSSKPCSLLWCTKNHHWVHRNIFGDLWQCENCQIKAHNNRHWGRVRQSEAVLQVELDEQIDPQPQPQPLPQPLPQSPPPPPPPLVDPLTGSAVTTEERVQLELARGKLMNIKMESCVSWKD